MNKYVLKRPQDYLFEKLGIKGKKYDVASLTKKSGFVYIETEKGHETVIRNQVCDCYYYILEGKGYFVINDKKEEFEKDDLVVIPAGLKFTYKGTCKMLRATTPAYYPEQEETLYV